MQRRRHHKSRQGCVECKRRHIRCDQTKPACLNCTTGDRECVFASLPPGKASEATAAAAAVPSPASTHGSHGHLTPGPLTPVTSHPSAPSSTTREVAPASAGYHKDGLYSLTHLKLLDHFLVDRGILSDDVPVGAPMTGRRYVAHVAFKAPYLLHELLAYSAWQMSVEGPRETSQEYGEMASHLQMQALNEFNASPQTPSIKNSEAIFLFSCFLGTQLLSESLTNRDLGLEGFVDGFLRSVKIQRGVKDVATECARFLPGTQVWDMIGTRHILAAVHGHQSDCSVLRQLILDTAGIPFAVANAYYKATDKLQWALDQPAEGSKEPAGFRSVMNITWPMLIDDEYLDMLTKRDPIALIIFAHYGAVLHTHGSEWLFQDAGAHIVKMVGRYLGKPWERYMSWPMEAIQRRSERVS